MALVFAWLSLIGVLAGGIGYVYLSGPPVHLAEDAATASDQPEAQTAHAGSDSQTHSTEASEHTAAEDHTNADAKHQAPAEHSDSDKDHAEAAQPEETASDLGEHAAAEAPAAIEGQEEAPAPQDHGVSETADKQPDSHGDSKEERSASASTGEPAKTAKNAEVRADTPQTETHAETTENPQQATLPKVTAPDHKSLPLWQRNRQNIDRRWLKDAEGNPKPRIAFVLSELGHARIAAEEIIKKLPPAITLSFSPYANPRSLEYLSALARANGHEVMLDLPLEPIDFPQRDPGPKALLTALEPKENLDRLTWSLERTTGYVGVAVWMGSRFVTSPRQMRPLFEAIHDQGLIFLDNAEREDSLAIDLAGEFNVPTISSHRYVDVPLASRDAIDARLAQVERIALQFGSAVAMGRPFPVTVERLAEWSTEIEKRGIVLVPITVLAEEAARKQKLAYKPVKKSVPKAKENASDSSSAAH